MTPTFKSCACGLSYTREAWLALPFRGLGSYDFKEEGMEVHESRDCSCGSTLSVPVSSRSELQDSVRRALDQHKLQHDALVAVQERCSMLLVENRRLQKLVGNASYGKEGVRTIDRRSAYPYRLETRADTDHDRAAKLAGDLAGPCGIDEDALALIGSALQKHRYGTSIFNQIRILLDVGGRYYDCKRCGKKCQSTSNPVPCESGDGKQFCSYLLETTHG
jgi:hypothetical protein